MSKDLALSVERELEAQLAIFRALKPLGPKARKRVLTALHYLAEAEALVPGILKIVQDGFSSSVPRRVSGKASM